MILLASSAGQRPKWNLYAQYPMMDTNELYKNATIAYSVA